MDMRDARLLLGFSSIMKYKKTPICCFSSAHEYEKPHLLKHHEIWGNVLQANRGARVGCRINVAGPRPIRQMMDQVAAGFFPDFPYLQSIHVALA